MSRLTISGANSWANCFTSSTVRTARGLGMTTMRVPGIPNDVTLAVAALVKALVITLTEGVPVDSVIGDFMAGEIEHIIDNISKDCDCIIVEGQGAFTHMLYSGVTLGLLHGSMPDYMILTHDANRKLDTAGQPIGSLEKTMGQYVDMVSMFKPSKFVGINLMTVNLNEKTALDICKSIQAKHDLPTTDLVRFGDRGLIEHIDFELRQWN